MLSSRVALDCYPGSVFLRKRWSALSLPLAATQERGGTEERGILTQRPSFPRPALHPMEYVFSVASVAQSCTLSVSRRFVAGRDDSRSADSFVRAFRPPAGDSRTRLSALLRLRPHRVVSVSPEIVAGRVNLSSSSSSSFSSSEMGRSRTRTRRRTMTIGLRLGRAALYVSGRLLAKSTVGNAASAW